MTVSCPSFVAGESGGAVFLERRHRFFQVSREGGSSQDWGYGLWALQEDERGL